MNAPARASEFAPSIIPSGTKYVGSAKYPAAQANRVANDSALTSGPNFTDQVTPRPSRTVTFGDVPAGSSFKNVNGGCGALSRPPGPPAKSKDAIGPGSRHKTAWPSAPIAAATDKTKPIPARIMNMGQRGHPECFDPESYVSRACVWFRRS